MTTIDLGPLTFTGTTRAGWSFRSLTDWWGATPNKLSADERPRRHGAFPRTEALRKSRAISYLARFTGAGPDDVLAAFDELAAVGAEGPVRMGVTTGAGRTWRDVIVEASPAAEVNGRWFGDMTVDCVADDPRRYADGPVLVTGPPVSAAGRVWPEVWPKVWPTGGASGRVVLTNAGKAPSAPSFVLAGGFDSAVITCVEDGSTVAFGRPVPDGSSVRIDYGTRRAVLDGVSDVSTWIRGRQWRDVPGGESRTFQFDVVNPVGSPVMSGQVNSAWW